MKLKRKDHIINNPSTLFQFYQIFKDRFAIYPLILKMMMNRSKIDVADDAVFLLFTGAGRSGSTLVSSIINAHENVLISNELDICRFCKPFINKKIFLKLIKHQDNIFLSKGRQWTGYSYDIGHCSKKKKIKVIGDKKSGITSIRLSEQPNLFDKIESRLEMPIKLINHSRNPFDVIATMANRQNFTIRDATDHYFRRIEGVNIIKRFLVDEKEQILDTHHENLVEKPETEIKRICRFIGISDSKQHIDSCKKILFKKISRNSVLWDQDDVKNIESKVKRIRFLSHYKFEENFS